MSRSTAKKTVQRQKNNTHTQQISVIQFEGKKYTTLIFVVKKSTFFGRQKKFEPVSDLIMT
jgi:hypothetical protein